MKSILQFVKTTFLGGILFLLPLILGIFLTGKALHWVAAVVKPVAKLFAIGNIGGVGVEYVFAVLLLILVGFLAGLAARTGLGRTIRSKLENLVLGKMPGYNLLRGLTAGNGEDTKLLPILLRISPERWQLGFLVERRADGWCTVFTPSAPTPSSGAVHLVRPDQVRELHVEGTEVVKVIMKIGEGFGKLAGEEVKGNED